MKSDSQTEFTLSSINGMRRAQIPDALRERIIVTLATCRGRVIRLRRPWVMLMAAGLALLIGFNVYTLTHRNAKPPTEVAGASNPLADEYFSPAPSI